MAVPYPAQDDRQLRDHRAAAANSRVALLASALADRPRLRLAALPTPLHLLPRFSDLVGREIWIKRDDLTGLAFGGNKARKLEFILAGGVGKGFDTVVTLGATQSNHARSVAAAARIVGWDCHLVLGGTRPDTPSGNLALDAALRASIHFAGTDDWSELEDHARQLADELATRGKRPLLLPMGGSTAVGALGFVEGYLELLDQCSARGLSPRQVVFASSTGGTQAGLVYARGVITTGPEILGVGVAKRPTDITNEVSNLIAEIADLLAISPVHEVKPVVLDGYLGAGYAQPSPGASAAAERLLRTEAIFTDSVYSAKALHAVVDLARNDAAGGPLVYWHTGGTPALFADSIGITRWPRASGGGVHAHGAAS